MNDRVLIAGTNSGCGKTTVTCALLQALRRRGVPLRSYKCGPDYIDPMFHREVIGVPAANLDPFFMDGEALCRHLGRARGCVAVAEGVMGYYDGIGAEGRCSTHTVAQRTQTPVILLVNAGGSYTSAMAVVQGFRDFRPDSNIRGVIFNNVSPMVYAGLKYMAEDAGVMPLGCLPRRDDVFVGSRHLGLLTAGEVTDLRQKLETLGAMAEEHLDLDGILALASSAPALPSPLPVPEPKRRVRIAVARDEAFCFLYEENLQLLSSLGAELVFFSPLHDRALPENVGGLYLPGGYPELHTAELSANPIRREIAAAIRAGLPTVAECGGFLYLHEALEGAPMAEVIHADAHRTERLQRFGYVTLTAGRDNLLCPAGTSFPAHEFHYYDSGDNGADFTAEKPDGRRSWPCVHATPTLWAGFPHLDLPAAPELAERWVRKAADYACL